jgi:hypothetical protein
MRELGSLASGEADLAFGMVGEVVVAVVGQRVVPGTEEDTVLH